MEPLERTGPAVVFALEGALVGPCRLCPQPGVTHCPPPGDLQGSGGIPTPALGLNGPAAHTAAQCVPRPSNGVLEGGPEHPWAAAVQLTLLIRGGWFPLLFLLLCCPKTSLCPCLAPVAGPDCTSAPDPCLSGVCLSAFPSLERQKPLSACPEPPSTRSPARRYLVPSP